MTSLAFRTCRKKVEYSDPRKAKRKASFFKKNNKSDLKPYGCKVCKKWHLTKKK